VTIPLFDEPPPGVGCGVDAGVALVGRIGPLAEPVADQLARVPASWRPITDAFAASVTGQALIAKVDAAVQAGDPIYPGDLFAALHATPLDQVRVVILGQDPYHGPGQAHGLAFSVPPGQKIPPSLRNLFKERQRDLGLPPPASGDLSAWARQGVLLLNTSLSVRDGQAASHARWGWEALTDALVAAVAQRSQPAVFMLWGAHAQSKRSLIEGAGAGNSAGVPVHLILACNHPSPLSATRPPAPFMGCGHLGQAQRFWAERGQSLAW
jgi:uracil-DNA glycosylase